MLKRLRNKLQTVHHRTLFSGGGGETMFLTVSGVEILMETLNTVTSWFKIHIDDCRLTKSIKTHPFNPLFWC